MARYSLELRERVYKAAQGRPVREVATEFGVSESFVRRLLRRQSETGSVAPLPRTNAGRKPKLTDADLAVLRESVLKDASRTLREHRDIVGVDCSISVIHAAIKKLGLHSMRAAALDHGHHGHEYANGISTNGHSTNGHLKTSGPETHMDSSEVAPQQVGR